MFHWRRAHLIALAFVVAASVLAGRRAIAADKPAVSMTLHSIMPTGRRVPVFPAFDGSYRPTHAYRFTNQIFYQVVFQVTNAGSVPVSVSSCGCSLISTNFPMPLGMFGGCNVPPFANALLSFLVSPNNRQSESFRYVVSEPTRFYEKVGFAAARLKANLSGKAKYNDVWPSDMWSPAYEINSPVINEWPDLSLATELLLPVPPKDALDSVLGQNWSTESVTNAVQIPAEDELQFQMEMERLRRMLEDKRNYDQSRDRGSLLSQRAAHPAALRHRNSVAKFEKDAEDQDPEAVAEELDAACAWRAHFRARDV